MAINRHVHVYFLYNYLRCECSLSIGLYTTQVPLLQKHPRNLSLAYACQLTVCSGLCHKTAMCSLVCSPTCPLELRARTEHHAYRSQCNDAEAAWNAHFLLHVPITTMHYLYDFAQQVYLPFDCQQTGPAYFKTARKYGIFGDSCMGKAEQVNYLVDEAENPGKGADGSL